MPYPLEIFACPFPLLLVLLPFRIEQGRQLRLDKITEDIVSRYALRNPLWLAVSRFRQCTRVCKWKWQERVAHYPTNEERLQGVVDQTFAFNHVGILILSIE